MNKVRLGDVATVLLSNVDKKSVACQKEVRLCNFTDVYYNWAITSFMHNGFMKATANDSQIQSLSISKGMVAITKDSETKYDIGISTYIADDFDDVVLGYHCALIKPNNKMISGKYLNAILHSSYAQKYFENNASGSGQRYTLSKEIIEDMKIPYIDIKGQKKIGDISSNIDRKIDINNQINDNLQQQLKLLYDYWFNQFDFPDENGKPYKSSGGLMLNSKKLKQSIPYDWNIINIREISNITWGQCPDGKNILPSSLNDTNLFDYCSGAGDMKGGFLVDCQAKTNDSRRYAHQNDILVSVAGKIGDMCFVDHTISLGRAAMAYTANNEEEIPFIYMTLKALNKKMEIISSGSIQKVINNDNIDDFNFAYNSSVTSRFSKVATPIFKSLVKLSAENKELVSLRDWLLPVLMNGQATIQD